MVHYCTRVFGFFLILSHNTNSQLKKILIVSQIPLQNLFYKNLNVADNYY